MHQHLDDDHPFHPLPEYCLTLYRQGGCTKIGVFAIGFVIYISSTDIFIAVCDVSGLATVIALLMAKYALPAKRGQHWGHEVFVQPACRLVFLLQH